VNVRLLPLLRKFKNTKDVQSRTAYFQTNTPWIAPLSYLNIIFSPAAPQVLRPVAQKLDMPRVLVSFLERQNGAILFSGALFVSGVHGAQDLLERDDPFSRLPFNIEDLNSDWPPQDSQMLNIGGYGADGSVVCIHRRSLRIYLFKRNNDHLGDEPYNDWPSLENWIASEITRLSSYFDEQGRRRYPVHDVPGRGSHC
jgi:hypothetical protein